MLLVRDRMSVPAITIAPDTVFHAALKLMRDNTLRRLPVTDDAGRLMGVVTERDLLRTADRYFQAAIEVDELMIRTVITTTPDTSIVEAATQMVNNKVGGLPVVDAGNRVVGLITVTDIFQTLVELLSAEPDQRSAAAGG